MPLRDDPRWHPQIFFRLRPTPAIVDTFDDWQRSRHGPALIKAPGAVHFGYFAAPTDAPAALSSGPTRMDFYSARSVEDLFAWLRSAELAAELADGDQWFGSLRDVDGQPFSANVYVPFAVSGEIAPPDASVYVVRIEVPSDREREFDHSIIGAHLAQFEALPGFILARAFLAIREDVPVPLYRSPGNRMMRVEFDPERFGDALESAALMNLLERERQWEDDLPYVVRDVFVHRFHLVASNPGRH